ncbi:sugar-binding transcriptional regulator [Listeria ivanovii]|uniref:Putative transcription repressor of dra/nupC/pdp operon DeoR n=1 Tax=Listeria ivanovii (strain ATCC BAA-678 / PAM 55) TaxID=881621 RepID=G2ZCS7_LISIP|nr:sugar-binding transcriptional regulator [Listeria ivanovii]AHI56510.1 RNA polymerase sigma70 [Listeria ivanovii WSLC3009]AIS65929.1 RNA polymerase sigma70 [Listeria ivanovii subsp. ivanovii]MBC1759031.1 sugar-binding transcriptional regulator [Listeria ivanovii]MBK3914055.1 sugar-binding transcriptional regulator [Listeria ivanovii subsp. ivanovii]MBK3921107.1 sugar-binding transcriptional regulator [Listeria ivanovii subsp. ivanovii]
MDKQKEQLSVEVARLYYQADFSQQEIAARLGVSRPTVSRLLQNAKTKGYVKIEVQDPFANLTELATALKEKYQLKNVSVAFSQTSDYTEITKQISQSAAKYLTEIIRDGDILGVSWGTTMYKIAQKLTPSKTEIKVVQLKGGVSHSDVNTYAAETLALFGTSFDTSPVSLPLPVVLDNPVAKQMVEADRHIKNMIDLGKKANVAIFTVGTVRDEALLFRLGYFSDAEKNRLKEKAVGDICSRFFTINGEVADQKMDERTIGINLQDLKQKETTILVAGGERKLKAIHGALCGGYANHFITDQFTAKNLLEQNFMY